MKIEIWSDIICPFCYIGKRKLDLALEKLGIQATIEWRSFELDPKAPINYGYALPDMLHRKYGISYERALSVLGYEKAEAESLGLYYNWEQAKPGNTLLAHRMIHLAKELGLGLQTKNAYFEAYFRDGKAIGDAQVVEDIALKVGLPADKVKNVLTTDIYLDKVRADEQEAYSRGVQGVPYFVINGKTIIAGAVPVEQFVATLQKVLDEESSTVTGDNCTDGFCAV